MNDEFGPTISRLATAARSAGLALRGLAELHTCGVPEGKDDAIRAPLLELAGELEEAADQACEVADLPRAYGVWPYNAYESQLADALYHQDYYLKALHAALLGRPMVARSAVTPAGCVFDPRDLDRWWGEAPNVAQREFLTNGDLWPTVWPDPRQAPRFVRLVSAVVRRDDQGLIELFKRRWIGAKTNYLRQRARARGISLWAALRRCRRADLVAMRHWVESAGKLSLAGLLELLAEQLPPSPENQDFALALREWCEREDEGESLEGLSRYLGEVDRRTGARYLDR